MREGMKCDQFQNSAGPKDCGSQGDTGVTVYNLKRNSVCGSAVSKTTTTTVAPALPMKDCGCTSYKDGAEQEDTQFCTWLTDPVDEEVLCYPPMLDSSGVCIRQASVWSEWISLGI